jgi:hypothetical protein
MGSVNTGISRNAGETSFLTEVPTTGGNGDTGPAGGSVCVFVSARTASGWAIPKIIPAKINREIIPRNAL